MSWHGHTIGLFGHGGGRVSLDRMLVGVLHVTLHVRLHMGVEILIASVLHLIDPTLFSLLPMRKLLQHSLG